MASTKSLDDVLAGSQVDPSAFDGDDLGGEEGKLVNDGWDAGPNLDVTAVE